MTANPKIPDNNKPLLSDGWTFVTRRMSEERGWWPNRVAYNKRDVLICVQCRGENRDFSLSADRVGRSDCGAGN